MRESQIRLKLHGSRKMARIQKIKITETTFMTVNEEYVIIAERNYPDPGDTAVVLAVKANLSEYVTWLRVRGNEFYHGHYFLKIVDAVEDFKKRS